MRKSGLIFVIIFSICLLCSVAFAECKHEFNVVEENASGKHYRICTICDYKENSSKHSMNSGWSFDDEGKYHFYKCVVSDCTYEYKKGEHIGGTHDNNGVCSICNEIYQTHELNAQDMKVNESSHWYTCSYNGCDYVYDKEPHEETEFVTGDLTYHWYRCKSLDCTYKFDKEKHYGGNSNDGYCEFELCKMLYMAKLQIDEYQYREYNVGDKDKLVATIIPEGIEVPKAEYKWSSSMPEVVSIDKEGNIDALREGIAIIYAEYGKYKAKCVIVVGDLEFSIKPVDHTLYVDEIGISTIDVTYKKNNKKININEYVDFKAFWWKKNSLKADIKDIVENQVNFIGINETDESVIFNMWLNNKLKIIEEKLEKGIKVEEEYDKKELLEFKKEITVNVVTKPEDGTGQKPGTDPGDGTGQKPGTDPGDGTGQKPGTDSGKDSEDGTGQKPGNKDDEDSEEESGKKPDQGTSVEGPGHNPEAPVQASKSQNMVNRRHVCSTQGYFPNPKNPEGGHLKRCYYQGCEFYTKGIEGTEAQHSYKYNEDREVEMCIICYYEKGSGVTEPQIIHSRDFGIDVLQSQFLIVQDETTEIDVIITGVEKDLKIHYGPKDGELKSTEGRDDENSVYLKWDVKDEYAKEAFDIKFEKRDDERIITVDLKEGYIQPTRTEVDLILENKFGEKRIETIELIKEAPERAQFILRFSSDVISALKVGETKEINVICKSQYGYAEGDRKEVQNYYKSKNLVNYEDIELKWEGRGGITATGASTPDSKGYAKGQITGVSVTDNKNPAELIITATAKYENEDLIDEIERELKRGIIVYEVKQSSGSGSSQTSAASGGGSSNGGGNSGSALPIAAGVIGALALGAVFFIVNHTTKG